MTVQLGQMSPGASPRRFIQIVCQPQAAGTFNHNGFADLSKRLTADLGQDVKFLQPVAVNITSTATADLKKEVADKCTQNPNENQIYAITCPEKSRRAVKQLLDDRGCTCYLITE